jgi:hypothetical protein
MGVEKIVLSPEQAVKAAQALGQTLENLIDSQNAPQASEAPKAPEAPKQKWKFVKLFAVAQELNFKDGSSFQFRLKRLNDKSGFDVTSELVTEDAVLAENLRSLAPGFGVVEVKV